MNLHSNKKLLQDAILATAEFLEMREIYVEKDYWVTVALYEIFHSDIADQSVFKGGTALSKFHRLIERFSEDIDLVVLRNKDENDTQLKKKIRGISKVVEKIMSLVRFSRSEEPIIDLRNKIRHVYDIHQMLKDDEIQQFFKTNNFNKMLITVGQDDMIGYKNNNKWIPEHPSTALIFEKPQETWKQLSTEYNSNFKDIVTGELPAEIALINTLTEVADRLRNIKWEIK